MGREIFEPNQEIQTENGETSREEAGAAEELGTEDTVVQRIEGDETPGIDQESLQEPGAGLYEAPWDPKEEE